MFHVNFYFFKLLIFDHRVHNIILKTTCIIIRIVDRLSTKRDYDQSCLIDFQIAIKKKKKKLILIEKSLPDKWSDDLDEKRYLLLLLCTEYVFYFFIFIFFFFFFLTPNVSSFPWIIPFPLLGYSIETIRQERVLQTKQFDYKWWKKKKKQFIILPI